MINLFPLCSIILNDVMHLTCMPNLNYFHFDTLERHPCVCVGKQNYCKTIVTFVTYAESKRINENVQHHKCYSVQLKCVKRSECTF